VTWVLVLKELLTYTRDGEWGKGEAAAGLVEVAVVRGTDFEAVRNGDVENLPRRWIPKHVLDRKRLHADDILLETAGGTKDQPTGRTVLLKGRTLLRADLPLVCASFSRFLRVDGGQIDPHYLYWFLQDLYARREMYTYHIQHTGVARFQYTQFATAQEVPILDRRDQEAIAAVLGALDDKIELNRRMNRTLEAMARALFRSWFVDFDPVHAKAEDRAPAHMDAATAALFPDRFGEDGLPQGWRLRTVGDILELAYGKSLTKDARQEGPFPVYGSGGIAGTHVEALVSEPTIVVGRKGTVGSLYWAPRGCFPIDTTFFVRSSAPMNYTYRLLETLGLSDMNTDAAVPGLNRNNVYRLKVPAAGDELLAQFEALAGAWQRAIDHTLGENRTLAVLRDTLLPKLMSGELRVREAERAVAEVA
jgi:type I restriction enzyme, S subunit